MLKSFITLAHGDKLKYQENVGTVVNYQGVFL
jgi:hypothetical protein